MSKDLQIIKELESRFGEIEYTINNNKKATDLVIEFKSVETKDLELVGELTSLEWLHLSGNKITSIQNLSKLINLKGLFICENQITTIQGLEKLANLQMLWIGWNQVSKIQGLDKLTNLEHLRLNNNQITTIQGLDKLVKNKLVNLRRLDLTKNNIPREEIEQFKNNNSEIKVF